MEDSTTPRRSHLALDTGWPTAAAFAVFFCFCVLATAIGVWRIFTGAPVSLKVTWETGLLLAAALLPAPKIEYRVARFAAALVALSFGSQILLAGLGASHFVRSVNAEIMRVVDTAVLAGLCVWIAIWFKQRIRQV